MAAVLWSPSGRASRGGSPRAPRRWAALLGLAVLGVGLVGAPGCSRQHYRRQADAEVQCVLGQKAAVVGAAEEHLQIGLSPLSRMYDPHDPDAPPMPPDDPLSHRYMQCVDCKQGSPCWRHVARTPFVENPEWRQRLPLDSQGRLPLDLEGAMQVALLHSPDYQSQLEELYLSALDVTFERFRFDTQFFGGASVFYTADGRTRNGTGDSSSLLQVSPARTGNRFRAERLTSTGGTLVVGLANSLVWQFAGPDNYASTTLLDFSLVQPLLRAGGRTVVLERLTIAERALLANVRSMERYRRGYYVFIATGGDPGRGPSRRGGFFGGAGLEGFSGVGGGGFGRVGGFGGFGFGQAGGFTGGAGAQAAGGYLGLLQSAQVLRNQRANVAALRDSVEQLTASYDAGRIDRFQVDLARQALFNAQSQLLSAEAQYGETLDNFKGDLGLPPDVEVRLTDPMLDRFNLRDERLVGLQTRVADAAAELRVAALERAEKEAPGGEDREGDGRDVEELPALRNPAAEPERVPEPPESVKPLQGTQLAGLAREAREQLAVVRDDYARLLTVLPQRAARLESLGERAEATAAFVDRNLLSSARLRERVKQLEKDIDALALRLEKAAGEVESLADQGGPSRAEADRLRRASADLSSVLLELSLLQARARLDAVDVPETRLTPEQALAIASLHRPDWANARAGLVDSWRLVAFNANDLMSDLDIVFSGDLGNVGDNPLRLRGTQGRLRVGLEFDAPLTRLSERNVYRQSLIEFQQARRAYYRFVDDLYEDLRSVLRQARLNEINLELRREAVLVAIAQVDITQLRLSEPPPPGVEVELSNTTARDLVQALSDLLNVQNDFLSVWVNNEVQLLSLEFQLGLMQLDDRGVRVPLGAPFEAFVGEPVCVPPGGDLPTALDARYFEIGPDQGAESQGGAAPGHDPAEPSPLGVRFTPDLTARPRHDTGVVPASHHATSPAESDPRAPGR